MLRQQLVSQTVAASRTPREHIAIRYELFPFDAPIEILIRTPRTLDGAPSAVTIPHFAHFVGTTVIDRQLLK